MLLNVARIEVFLGERGFNKTVFASRCGVSRQAISTILKRGSCEPKTAAKLAAGLDVKIEEIVKV